MLSVTVSLLIQRILNKNDPLWLKVLLGLFFVTATTNIFINAGRAGYVLFAILMLVLLLLMFKKRILGAALAAFSIIAVSFTMAYQFSDTFTKKLNETVRSVKAMYLHSNFNSSLGARAFVVISSNNIVFNSWIFGSGTGDQLDAVKNNIEINAPKYKGMARGLQHLHNEYLTAILQFGILGLLAFLYIPYQLFRYPHDDINTKNLLSILAVAVLSFAFIETIVHGLGALLTLVLLVSLAFRDYAVDNAQYSLMNVLDYVKYSLAISLIEIVSWYS
jgi:O-antigen ligase